MGEVIVITSGKGGVGKTTTTANLGQVQQQKEKSMFNRYRHWIKKPRRCNGTREQNSI